MRRRKKNKQIDKHVPVEKKKRRKRRGGGRRGKQRSRTGCCECCESSPSHLFYSTHGSDFLALARCLLPSPRLSPVPSRASRGGAPQRLFFAYSIPTSSRRAGTAAKHYERFERASSHVVAGFQGKLRPFHTDRGGEGPLARKKIEPGSPPPSPAQAERLKTGMWKSTSDGSTGWLIRGV